MGQRTVFPPAPGVELGYAENTGDFTTASASPIDVTGLSTTVVVGIRPVIVEFGCSAVSNNTLNAYVFMYLMEGATQIGFGGAGGTAANAQWPGYLRRRLAPTPGSHTYKVQVAAFGGGTAKIAATATSPSWIQVTEI
jgi:hypothetical protein